LNDEVYFIITFGAFPIYSILNTYHTGKGGREESLTGEKVRGATVYFNI
jgi:hypothetical protein